MIYTGVVANLLRELYLSDRIKICVSSRYLPVLQKALNHDRRLQLQDLAEDEIYIAL